MDLYAPEDCFVKSVASKGSLQAGAVIADLDSPDLAKQMDRLETFAKELAINSRKLSDGRRAETRDLQVKVLDQLQTYSRCVFMHASYLRQVRDAWGILKPEVVMLAEARAEGTKASVLKQQVVVAQFDRETADLQDRVAEMTRHLDKEQLRLADLLTRLTVHAPVDGNFLPLCGPGMFLKKGHTIGSLT